MSSFNFTFDPGTSIRQMVGFEMAGRIWSSYLTDNITINLHVGVSGSLGDKIIGGALPAIRSSYEYADYYTHLNADVLSADDRLAVSNLSREWTNTSFDVFIEGQNFSHSTTTYSMNMTRAVAKAVEIDPHSTALDGYIVFSNLSSVSGVSWNYDYTRSTTAATNSLDFLSTAIHEIGHVLGFVSGLDRPDWLKSQLSWGDNDDEPVFNNEYMEYLNYMDGVANSVHPMDLFRYSNWWQTDISYGSQGGNKYFSLDGGQTAIASFATGADTTLGGDGYQASHWKAGTRHIMAPTLSTGQRASISATDLRLFDVIGWDIASTGINTSMNLSTLQTQAKQSLASRLGQTVSWLNANANLSPTQLTKNRDLDIYNMLVDSQVYDLSRVTRPTSGTTTTGTGSGGTGLSQVFAQSLAEFMQMRGLFSTLDELEILSGDDGVEPFALQGMLFASPMDGLTTQEFTVIMAAATVSQPGAALVGNAIAPSTMQFSNTGWQDLRQFLLQASNTSSIDPTEARSSGFFETNLVRVVPPSPGSGGGGSGSGGVPPAWQAQLDQLIVELMQIDTTGWVDLSQLSSLANAT